MFKLNFTEVLRDGSKGTVHDKARILALSAMVLSGDSTSNYEEFETAFRAGCAAVVAAKSTPVGAEGGAAPEAASVDHTALVERCVKAVSFIRRLQSLQVPISRRLGSGGGSSGLTSLLTTAQSRGNSAFHMCSEYCLLSNAPSHHLLFIASSLVAKATSFFAKFSPMHVTRVAEALAEGRSCQENDTFCTLDPRRLGQSGSNPEQQPRYSEVIVFVVGGGCYSEYFNLMEMVKLKLQTPGGLKNIYYGSSELMSGTGFMSQLERLGTA